MVEAFARYLSTAAARRPCSLALEKTLQLHNLEAAALHQLNTCWGRIEHSLGLITVAQMHAYHFAARDRCKEVWSSHWDSPEEGTMYVNLDFKEHDTLPRGPSEPGHPCHVYMLTVSTCPLHIHMSCPSPHVPLHMSSPCGQATGGTQTAGCR